MTGGVMWNSSLVTNTTLTGDPINLAYIVGSAGFDNNNTLYVMSSQNRLYKVNANPDKNQGGGRVLFNFTITAGSTSAFTPVYYNDLVVWGGSGRVLRAYNATTGASVIAADQPHVLSEAATGSIVVIPIGSNMLSPVNQTLSSPTMRNGTVWAGIPITYFNTTSSAQVAAYTYYKGQYTFSNANTTITTGGLSGAGFAVGQAGPTIFCATMNEVNVTATVLAGGTGAGSQSIRLSAAGDNIWSDWGGWEVWSSPIFASFGTNSLVYYGSESFAVHCVNASNGVPLTWWTTGGPMGASQAVYDGKLYATSAEGKIWCFEEHSNVQTTTTASIDTNSPSSGSPVTVTVKLNSVPTINVYEEIAQPAPIPSLPNQTVTVTFIKPDGKTTVDFVTETDLYGNAVVTYTPDVAGDWTVVAGYNGEMLPRVTYAQSHSDSLTFSSATTAPTETPVQTSTPAPVTATPIVTATPVVTSTPIVGTNSNIALYAGIAVVVIVVIVLAALVLMRRKK